MSEAFDELVRIMERLRAPNGCPWDRKQDLDTLRPYLLEESYELLEAMERKDWQAIKEELGDLLLQIVFISQIAKEKGKFTVDDVAKTISKKLIHRHPHVFGNEKRETPEQVEKSWDELKVAEGKSPLPKKERGIPSLLYGYRASKRASKLGFDWEKPEGVFEKVVEELEELKKAVESGSKLEMEEELGDLLFSVVNLSRFIRVNPEEALRKSVDKFVDRFNAMVRSFGDPFEFKKLPQEEMDRLWEKVKESDLETTLIGLIREKAFMYDPEKGFRLASGKVSPYYVDCRRVTFTPEGAYLASMWLLKKLKEIRVDCVGGPAYGSIPLVVGASILGHIEGLKIKPVIFRKEKKEHGTGGAYLGYPEKGNTIALVDDVITTGGSVERAAEEAKDAGLIPKAIICMVDRRENRGDIMGLPVVSLTTLEDLKKGL